MVAIKHILCPVDLSSISGRALEYAALAARWYRADIRALLVEPRPLAVPDFPPLPGPTPEAWEALATRLREFVAKTAPDVSVESVLTEGFVVPEILAQASTWPADLVVLGTHGRGGFEHLVLGSVTEKVLRKVNCPVLTVPPDSGATPTVPGPFTSILCATDFSYSSLAALEYAMSLAQEAGGRLTLIHAIPWELEEAAELLAPVVTEYRQMREAHARKRLAALIPEVIKSACQVDTILATGNPAQEVQHAARDMAADLIVMGVHGRSAINLALFGSTTHAVIRQAPCPVLTVRAPHARRSRAPGVVGLDVVVQ